MGAKAFYIAIVLLLLYKMQELLTNTVMCGPYIHLTCTNTQARWMAHNPSLILRIVYNK